MPARARTRLHYMPALHACQVARRHAALRRLLRGQVFLGMVGAMDRARVEAPDVVEDLFNAGVRFVHMSAEYLPSEEDDEP